MKETEKETKQSEESKKHHEDFKAHASEVTPVNQMQQPPNKPGSPSQYNLKLYQLLIKLLTHKDENREIVRALGDTLINHILASISELEHQS